MVKPHMKHPLFPLIVVGVLTILIQASCVSTALPVATATPTVPATVPVLPTNTITVPTDISTATQPIGGPLYVVINPPGDEYLDLQNSFIQAANSFGAEAEKYDDPYDKDSSISQIDDLIHSGAKGIAIDAFAPFLIGPAIAKAAKSAGVVLLAIQNPMKDENGKPLPIIKFDDKEMGMKVGEAASKLLIESGWLTDFTRKVGVLSLEVKSQPVCNARTDSEKAAMKAIGVPNKQIFPLQYDIIQVDSQDTTGKILSSHPDITNWVVFGCSDAGVAGSLKALDAAGVKTEDIIAIGIGAYEACIPWAAGQSTGFKGSLNISNQDLGRMAAAILNDAVVNGKTPPAVTIVPTTVIDSTNFKTTMDPVALAKCSQ